MFGYYNFFYNYLYLHFLMLCFCDAHHRNNIRKCLLANANAFVFFFLLIFYMWLNNNGGEQQQQKTTAKKSKIIIVSTKNLI